jgi:O-antigen/teichoic acid export membrane protein
MIPFLVVPLFGVGFAHAIRPAVVLALAASVLASANILNQGLRGAGRPHAGLASQLLGTAVMAFVALFFLRPFGLLGMALAVAISAGVQLFVLIAAAASWLGISPLLFWPFGAANVRIFVEQVAGLRLRLSRSLA